MNAKEPAPMPSVYDIKPGFQRLLRPLVDRLARAGVTPNAVTVSALMLSVVAGATIAWRPDSSGPLLVLPVVLLLRMALNAIDGMLAREHDMATSLGAVLNELGDVVSDAALYLPLALVPSISPGLMVVAVILAGLTETAGIVAERTTGRRRYDGPMGKSDRAVFFGALALAIGLGLRRPSGITAALVVVDALLVITVVNRARAAAGGST